MSKKYQVLLTGASGFLGWNFCQKWMDSYDLIGTYFRNCPSEINIKWERINLLETKQVMDLVKELKPDIIVHLAAISNAAFCEEHPALSHHVNVYTSIALAEAARLQGIPMIFASTDLVFNGSSPPYEEDDFCYPLSQYGTQKQMAEEVLLNDFEEVFVARFPLLFGFAPDYSSNFFTQTIQKLQNGETISAFTDELRTMISGDIAGQWLDKLIGYVLDTTIAEPKEKLLHVAGLESCSRYDFAIKTAKIFGLNHELVLPTLQKDLDLSPARPADVSLNSELASKTLLYQAPSLEIQLTSLFNLKI